MAIFINGDDTLKLQVGCYFANQASINTFYFKVSDATGACTLENWAAAWDLILAPLYKPILTNIASYYGVRVQRIDPVPLSVAVVSAAYVGAGTGGTEGLPSQVCGLVSTYTDKGGAAYRGRMYLPFPDESSNDASANKPDAGYIANIDAIGAALVGPKSIAVTGGSIDGTFIIWHRGTRTGTPTTGSASKTVWATQRRRGSLGQPNPYPPF